MIKKIYLAKPRGFCAGVERAVSIVEKVLKKHGPPIYVRHQIVHNQHVVEDFEKKGVSFVENLKNVPYKSVVIFSAHGSPPSLYKEAKRRNLQVYDAVCPLVTKVHLEAKRYEKEGYFVIYIGHKGHPESIGVLGEISHKSSILIETLVEAKEIKLSQRDKIVVLNQTTLSFDDTKKIINLLQRRFPNIILPPTFDICYATQNRQDAVKTLAKKVEIVLVIGSQESSNSQRLKEVAQNAGIRAYLVNDISEINLSWLKGVKTLGVTAGASAPKYLIEEVVRYFDNLDVDIEEIEVVKENIDFPLPKEVYESI